MSIALTEAADAVGDAVVCKSRLNKDDVKVIVKARWKRQEVIIGDSCTQPEEPTPAEAKDPKNLTDEKTPLRMLL